MPDPLPLPPLREDLRFVSTNGAATIFDPVRNRYYRLPASAAKALADWESGAISQDDAEALIQFLAQSKLTAAPAGGTQALIDERSKANHSLPMRLVHNYLFFRVPLFRPQRVLDAAYPFVRPLGGKTVRRLIIAVALIGLYLASRQWSQFADTFASFLTLEGAAFYGITLTFLKIFHELGHAFVARHFRCRVSTIGVAFMLMAPMLYTDVSDAWRLESKRARLLISAAGVLVEFALAALAIFAWAFLPDGPLRSAAYFTATTAIIASLFVNLSPFMRFDGYHLLADATGVENIGPRAFALGRWQMREILFGLGAPPPEDFTPALRRGLVAYAWGTWVYRLTLFIGIAVLVYHLFPKAIGIALFAIEIIFFIARPIMQELSSWTGNRAEILRTRRTWLTTALAGAAFIACLLPLDRHVSIPAVILAAQDTQIFAPEPARILSIQVKPQAMVAAGDVLAVLGAPALDQEKMTAGIKLAITDARLQRIAGDLKDRAIKPILERERGALLDELKGLGERQARLVIHSPFTGRITQMAEGLRGGAWVSARSPLFEVTGGGTVARGLLDEDEVARLSAGAEGWFVPDQAEAASSAAVLLGIGAAKGGGREVIYLASTHGGPVSADRGPDGKPVLTTGAFPVVARTGRDAGRAERGVLIMAATPESLLTRAFRRVASVFLRESGF